MEEMRCLIWLSRGRFESLNRGRFEILSVPY